MSCAPGSGGWEFRRGSQIRGWPEVGHPLGCLGGVGFSQHGGCRAWPLSSGAWHLSRCAWTGPRCLATGGQPGLQGRQSTSVGGTPPCFSHKTDVSMTPWVSDLQRMGGCGRPRHSRLRPPCSQGRAYPQGARPAPALAGAPCALPQAPVRSRALWPEREECTRAAVEPGGAWGSNCRDASPGPLSTPTRTPACASWGWSGRNSHF